MSKKNIIYIIAAVIVIISAILIVIAKKSATPEIPAPENNIPAEQQPQTPAQIEQDLQGIDLGDVDKEFQAIDESLNSL